VKSRHEIGGLLYKPGSKLYFFYLTLKSKPDQVAGTLERITHIFSKIRAPLFLLRAASSQNTVFQVVMLVDLAGCKQSAASIADELRRVPLVSSVDYESSITNGLALELKYFPLMLGGGRVILMRKEVYEGLIRGGWERFGSGYGQLLYITSFGIGRSMYRVYAGIAGDRDPLEIVAGLLQLTGLGMVAYLELDDDLRKAVVRVYDSFECELFRGVGEIRGNLVRGMLAGWLAERWGGLSFEQVTAREVKCIARGDPHCEYHITASESRTSRTAED